MGLVSSSNEADDDSGGFKHWKDGTFGLMGSNEADDDFGRFEDRNEGIWACA